MMTIRMYTVLQAVAINIILLSGSSCWAVFDENVFFNATRTGDIATIQAMVAEASQQHKDDAFAQAICSGQLEMVQFLLGMKIDGHQLPEDQIVNIHANDDWALKAAVFNGHLEVVQFLLGIEINGHQLPAERIANIHANNDEALQAAACYNRVEIMQFLLGMQVNGHQLPAERIANIHAKDDEALRLAARYNRLKTVRFLLGMNVTNIFGYQLSVDRIANIHANNDEALRSAVDRGLLGVACVLIKQGANVNVLTAKQREEILKVMHGSSDATTNDIPSASK